MIGEIWILFEPDFLSTCRFRVVFRTSVCCQLFIYVFFRAIGASVALSHRHSFFRLAEFNEFFKMGCILYSLKKANVPSSFNQKCILTISLGFRLRSGCRFRCRRDLTKTYKQRLQQNGNFVIFFPFFSLHPLPKPRSGSGPFRFSDVNCSNKSSQKWHPLPS